MKLSHLGATLCFVALAWCSRGADLTLTKTIPLPDVSGRIDHLGYDRAGQRLFVAALGNNSVEVVDVAGGRVLGSLPGFNEPQGIVYVAELNRLFVANGGDGTLCVMDGSSFSTRAIIPLGEDADNVRYDPAAHQVYVGYGEGGLAAIGAADDRVTAQIALVVHPESFQLETAGHRVFINLPDAHEIGIVDRTTRRVLAHWRLSTGGNFPLALDEPSHRLFVGCRSPARLLVVDTNNGRELARVELHRDCDDVFLDLQRRRAYASCGEGFLDIFDLGVDGGVKRTDAIPTAAGARTSYVDGNKIFVAQPKHGSESAAIRVYRVE